MLRKISFRFLFILALLLFLCVKLNMAFSINSSNLNLTKNVTRINMTNTTNNTKENVTKNVVVNLTLKSFSCKICKNGEKLTYKICLNVENSSKTRTYFVNYSIIDINDNFIKKPCLVKIKVKSHRCIKRSWTVKTDHEVIFIKANIENQSSHAEMPIYVMHSEKNYKNRVVSNITAKIPDKWISGAYNYIDLYICRGDVKSNTVYVKILKRKGKRFEHISKDVKIKLNKKDTCYDVVLPIYIKGVCKNEEAGIVIESKIFGKKEKRIIVMGNKKFCYRRHYSCHCYCQEKREEKGKSKNKRKLNETKKDLKAKIFCKNFVNSGKMIAKLYLINNEQPKNCTIKYYVFNKHEPLNLKGWKNEEKIYVKPFEIKIVNLSLNLKNYTGKAKFKVKIYCDNRTHIEILKEITINSWLRNKPEENRTKAKMFRKEKKESKNISINENKAGKVKIKEVNENRTKEKLIINAEMIKKRSFVYRLFHLLIKWFNLHHKSVI